MEDKLDKLLRIEKENNKMLKQIIRYINYTISNTKSEALNDFYTNVGANIISSGFILRRNK